MLIFLTLLLSFSQNPAPAPPVPPATPLQQAGQFLRQGQNDQAIAVLEPLVEAEPNNAAAWYWLGFCYHANKDWAKAVPAHERAASFPQTAAKDSFGSTVSSGRKAGGIPDEAEGTAPLMVVGAMNAGSGQRGQVIVYRYVNRTMGIVEHFRIEAEANNVNYGRCYLLPGVDGAVLRTWTCNLANATMGFDSTSLPDCNDDGQRDFLFTAAWTAVQGPQTGSVYLVAADARELSTKEASDETESR